MSSFCFLSVMLLAGYTLRSRIRLLRSLFLPSCVIGGIMALVIIQAAGYYGTPVPEPWIQGWSKLPGLLINVVFACLFLGIKLPRFSTLWRRAGPQLAYGQIVAWGQYVVGIGLFLLVIKQFFDLNDMFAGVLPVGFEGGHGTAGGMGPVFEKFGWAAGKDFALASATFGILGAIIFGMLMVNLAARRGHLVSKTAISDMEEDDRIGIIPVEQRQEAGKLPISSDNLEAFTFQLAVVGIAILIGIVLKKGIVSFEVFSPWVKENGLLSSFPLFPLCMIGGLIIQIIEEKFDKHQLIDPGLIRRIQNGALDILVLVAIATINVTVIKAGLLPLLILVAGGILWNIFCLGVLARRILPDAWFERGIAEMGQSMGITATGLLLLRVVDPDYKTPAAEAFASKQLLHEPFMGGGLWTGMAIPLIATIGPAPVLGIAVGAIAIWTIVILATGIHKIQR